MKNSPAGAPVEPTRLTAPVFTSTVYRELNVGDAGLASPTAYNVPSGENSRPITANPTAGWPKSVACPVFRSIVASCCGSPGLAMPGPQTLYMTPADDRASDAQPKAPVAPITVVVSLLIPRTSSVTSVPGTPGVLSGTVA